MAGLLLFLDLCTLILGLALLLLGGGLLVRGASSLARSIGVSPLIIGLTVVSLGTSAPELTVNLFAVLQNESALSFGNIFGSNLANIGLIVACTAIIKPLTVNRRIVTRELPIMLVITLIACFLALDGVLGKRSSVLDQSDGVILMLMMAIFLYYTIGQAMSEGFSKELDVSARREIYRSVGVAVVGLLGLMWGADLTVKGGVNLANAAGVPEVIVGLTVIAVGTSLPELTASVIAALRGQPDIAIGNVIGSNIFNIVLVAGVCAAIRPIPVPPGGFGDLSAVIVLSFVLWGVTLTNPRRIRRSEGIVLLVLYFSYIAWRSLS